MIQNHRLGIKILDFHHQYNPTIMHCHTYSSRFGETMALSSINYCSYCKHPINICSIFSILPSSSERYNTPPTSENHQALAQVPIIFTQQPNTSLLEEFNCSIKLCILETILKIDQSVDVTS